MNLRKASFVFTKKEALFLGNLEIDKVRRCML